MQNTKRGYVLGIDPGTQVTGYGVVAREGGGAVSLVECGVIRTSTGKPLAFRIREIYEGIAELIERWKPEGVSVEEVFHGKNARTALTLGHARGAILLAASLSGLEVAEYTAVEIKKSVTGTGRASKDQVGFMVQQRLRLKSAPTPADAADGVAAALCHAMGGGADGDGLRQARAQAELARQRIAEAVRAAQAERRTLGRDR